MRRRARKALGAVMSADGSDEDAAEDDDQFWDASSEAPDPYDNYDGDLFGDQSLGSSEPEYIEVNAFDHSSPIIPESQGLARLPDITMDSGA